MFSIGRIRLFFRDHSGLTMRSASILIADDDPFLRQLLTHKLTTAGYQVTAARDGGEAFHLAQSGRHDLIVLDALMPIMDGFEVLRRLGADKATKSTPVIMLTALKREGDIVGALKLGAADYLIKPFIPDELVARIGRLLPTETADERPLGQPRGRTVQYI